MAQLHIGHPDILEFIHAKDNCLSPSDPLANVNISIQIPDRFMRILIEDGMWPLTNPRNGQVVEMIPASTLWNEICQSAWRTGDPGVVFMDRVDEAQPEYNRQRYGRINSSNPCGEELTEDGNSCNLGSINLSRYWDYNLGVINYELLEQHVRLAVRFLDNVIDINWFPF